MTETPTQTLSVFDATLFQATQGANAGDALGPSDDLVLDDVYQLTAGATPATEQSLTLNVTAMPPYTVAPGSSCGQVGAEVFLDACATFMTPEGRTIEALVLVEMHDSSDVPGAIWLFPLAPMQPKTDYRLVGLSAQAALQRFAQLACVSFTAGTHITMASGAQKPVETLAVGDRVLTRDAGPQEIRWLGQTTLRATGALAPVRIKAGVLNNLDDLVVSPDHRLFVYQRSDEIGIGRSEVLVRARHLVNDDTIIREDGGHVDYHQMLFDHHQIIFAEGIAVESMLVDNRTSAALPEEMAALAQAHAATSHDDLEVEEELVLGRNAADLLKRGSEG